MAQWEKILGRVLSGRADANISFADLCGLLERLGYQLDRVAGSHHIFVRSGQSEIINIQPGGDGKAKAYQVRRIRQLLNQYSQTRLP